MTNSRRASLFWSSRVRYKLAPRDKDTDNLGVQSRRRARQERVLGDFPADRENPTSRPLFHGWGKHNLLSSCSFARCRWRVRICSSHVSAHEHTAIGWEEPPLLYFGRPPQCLSANPSPMAQPGRMNVGAAMWGTGQGAHDLISSTLDLEPPFPLSPMSPRGRSACPSTAQMLSICFPSPHPDCPSCPKSLTRSWRRSLAMGGNNRAAARNA